MTQSAPQIWNQVQDRCSAQEQQVSDLTSQQGGGEGLPNSHPGSLAQTHLGQACKLAGALRFILIKTGLIREAARSLWLDGEFPGRMKTKWPLSGWDATRVESWLHDRITWTWGDDLMAWWRHWRRAYSTTLFTDVYVEAAPDERRKHKWGKWWGGGEKEFKLWKSVIDKNCYQTHYSHLNNLMINSVNSKNLPFTS